MDSKNRSQTTFKRRPPRLSEVFQRYDSPLYFVTFNTYKRRKVLAQPEVSQSFRAFGQQGIARGCAIGRYVIMPDHVHFFVRLPVDMALGRYVGLMKQSVSKTLLGLRVEAPFWQEGFFDHLMRSSESYAEKWNYVRENPVRAGLVTRWEGWPYQGEVVDLGV